MMHSCLISLCAAVATLAAFGRAMGGDLVLAENGQSAYQIVLADNASPSTKHGAEELQLFLQQMTGAKLPIVSDQQPLGDREIILGDNADLKAINGPWILRRSARKGM